MEIRRRFFGETLLTFRFLYWWTVSLASLLAFDILWMSQTTFRGFSTLPVWPWLLLSATLLALPAIFNRNGVLCFAVLLIADLVMTANLMYCRTYFNAIPAASYALAGNLSDFTASVQQSYKWYFVVLPVISIGAFLIYRRLCRTDSRRMTAPDKTAYAALVAVLVLLCWAADIWRGGTLQNMKKMSESAYGSSSITPVYSLAAFLAYDMLRSAEKLSPEEEAEVWQWLAETPGNSGNSADAGSYASLAPDSADNGLRKRKNLVVILCESLESWPIEKEVEGKELTPFLNSLLKDSTVFYAPHVVSQVGSGRSIDAQLLILAGLRPMKNNVYAYDAIGNTYFTLPKALKERGARSYLLTCDKPYVWNEALVAEAFGIDTLLHSADFIINETAGPSRRLSDGSLMTQAVEKMKKREIWPEGEPAFLMAVTYSGHNPFNLPENLRRLNLRGDYPDIIKNYMVTANYTDYALSIMIDYLKTRSDYDDTLIVITGDHEGLASDRQTAMEHPSTRDIVDPGQHTPLIILNSPVAGRHEAQMGEVDIYSTLKDLLGLDDYPWSGLGISVLSPRHPGIAIGSEGEVYGDTTASAHATLSHLQKAPVISDRILRFDLLKNLQNWLSDK